MAASPDDGVSIRSVRLKVLYTFDAEQKDNHLARYPQSLDVQTAFVDDTNQIGVVDLKTCLEAVTSASPEITTGTDFDYTIYAYDYSEPDSPLVGQGMLSRALADQGPGAGNGTDAMVTGKLTKNVMGLFSKNAQETLEVKLRLTPVNSFPLARFRSGSVCSQDGSRPPWGNSSSSQPFQRSASPVDTSGLEAMHRMLSGESAPGGGPLSRPGTPNASQTAHATTRQNGNYSRPSSRAGTRPTSHARRDSMNSGYYSGEDAIEEGPARKRARITKVDWPTKSNYNIERQPESLRVAASTASSVRLHRPVAFNPATALQGILPTDEPVRPPTPIPASKPGRPRGRPKKNAPSNLVRGTQVSQTSPTSEFAPQADLLGVPAASPEDVRALSVSSTPANIPSSPPMIPEERPPAVGSPGLPPMLSTHHDSGFMSGILDELFGDDQLMPFNDFVLDKPGDGMVDEAGRNSHERPPDMPDMFPAPFTDINGMPRDLGAQSRPPMFPPPLPAPSQPAPRAQSCVPAPRVSMSSPRLAPAPIPRARQIMEEQQQYQREQMRIKPLAPAPAARSESVPRIIHRSQTWAPDSDLLTSDAPMADDARNKAATRRKVGKEQTRARLENAIANGEMPPFCDNCGAIETPAWRRAYAKTFECGWDDVETSLEQGECCYKEPLEHHADGTVKSFRGYKVEKRGGDEADDWVSITLCNPCGLWFHKQKCPRPREKWQKKDPKEKGKRKRNPPKGLKRVNGSAMLTSDAQTPASDESSPATEAPDPEENENENDREGLAKEDFLVDDKDPQLPPMPHSYRASSAGPGPRGLQSRNRHRESERQVQSSPGVPQGLQQFPVEVDLTPQPLRRQLFPPPNAVQVRSDPGCTVNDQKAAPTLPTFVRRSPRLNKTRDVFDVPTAAVVVTVDGKENLSPAPGPGPAVLDDGLADLFEEGPADVDLPPMTPTPKRRSERLFLRTPSGTPLRHFGTDLPRNADLSPAFRTPKAKVGQHPALAALLGTAPKNVHGMTPFTRLIHDAMTNELPPLLNLPGEEDPAGARSKNATPNKAATFDFPDLPSLKNSSPATHDPLIGFNFSEMTTDQLNSDLNEPFTTSNSTMPSSPPPGLFSFLDAHDDKTNSLWDDFIDPDMGQTPEELCCSDPDALSAPAKTCSPPLRRSPRKLPAHGN